MQYLGGSGGYLDDATQGDTARLHFISNGKYGYDGECQEDNGNLSDINILQAWEQRLAQLHWPKQCRSGARFEWVSLLRGRPCARQWTIIWRWRSRPSAVKVATTEPVFGNWYLASYTAESNGTLTTKSTAEICLKSCSREITS